MKTPEKIKKSIRECLGFHSDCEDVCDACPYWDEGPFCKGALCRDTIACIDQMEERISLNTLRDAMMSVALRYPDIVMHIHDEMVVEVPAKGAELALRDISEIMGDPIPWAPGLLLRGDGYLCGFYQKD